MAIKRRQGSPFWWYSFTIRGRRFRGSTKAVSRQEAEIIEARLYSEALLGSATGKLPEMTLNEACARYWTEHARYLPSASDLARHSGNLLRLIGKNVCLSDIDSNVVSSFVARRRGEPAKGRKGQLVANLTVNADVVHLRSIVERASNIWKVATEKANWPAIMLPEPEGRDRYLSLTEAERLLDAAAPHLRPVIEAALLTALRKDNLLSLDWRHVDLAARTITQRVKSKKPGGKIHTLPISRPLFMLLVTLDPRDRGPVFTYTPPHPSHAMVEAAQASVDRHHGNISAAARKLGLTDNGLRKRLAVKPPVPRAIKSIDTAWKAALRRADIEDFRFHDLRHTAATWMIQQGVPLEVVQDLLAHADIKTTQRYAHHAPGAKSDAFDTLAARFGHIGRDDDGEEVDSKTENGRG